MIANQDQFGNRKRIGDFSTGTLEDGDEDHLTHFRARINEPFVILNGVYCSRAQVMWIKSQLEE